MLLLVDREKCWQTDGAGIPGVKGQQSSVSLQRRSRKGCHSGWCSEEMLHLCWTLGGVNCHIQGTGISSVHGCHQNHFKNPTFICIHYSSRKLGSASVFIQSLAFFRSLWKLEISSHLQSNTVQIWLPFHCQCKSQCWFEWRKTDQRVETSHSFTSSDRQRWNDTPSWVFVCFP